MYKSIVFMVLVSVQGQRDFDSVSKDTFTPQSRGDLDSVIKDIFTTQSQGSEDGGIKEKITPRVPGNFDSILKDIFTSRSRRDLDSKIKDIFTPRSQGNLDIQIKNAFTLRSQGNLDSEIKDTFTPRSQGNLNSKIRDTFTPRSQGNLDSEIKDTFTPRSQGNLDSKIKDTFTPRSQGNLDSKIKDIFTPRSQGNLDSKIKDIFTPRSQGNLDSKIKDIFTPRSQGKLDSKIKDIFTPRSQGNLDSKIKDIFTPRNQGNPESKIKDLFTPRQQGDFNADIIKPREEAAPNTGSLKKEINVLELIFGPPAAGSNPGPGPPGTVTNLGDIGAFPSVTGTTNPGTISSGAGSNTGVNGNNFFASPDPSIVQPLITPDRKETEPCETDARAIGECVRIYQCSNSTFNKDGAGIIDIRVRDGPCKSYLDICCLPDGIRAPNDVITPAPPTAEEATRRSGCGWHNPKGVGIATIGDIDNEAKFGEFPWMVALLKLQPIDANQPDVEVHVYVGGGSLIHPSVVLTAAHYVSASPPAALLVRAGEWDTQTSNEIYRHQQREVKEIVTHEHFNSGNLFYDVGLLFLSEPIVAAPHISTACLPPPKLRAPPGARCFASGWGKDIFEKKGLYQVILKRIEVPVVDRKTCQERMRTTRLGRYFELHSSFMCAGGERGKDTCKGDGGSPLVCPIDGESGRFVQNGIVAWGIGCGQDGTPGVYADVSVVRDWIDDKVLGRGFDPATYTY